MVGGGTGLRGVDHSVRAQRGDQRAGHPHGVDAPPHPVRAVDVVRVVAGRGLPGGPGDPDGIYNAVYVHDEPGDSLTAPDDGSSFIQVVTWPRHGACPVGSTILTYSESSNPASPHFADQTKLFSKKRFLPDRFCPAQIAADPNLQTVTVTGS